MGRVASDLTVVPAPPPPARAVRRPPGYRAVPRLIAVAAPPADWQGPCSRGLTAMGVTAVVRSLEEEAMYEFLEYQVIDAMTCQPLTITRATPLAEIEVLFAQHEFNCLPVTEEGALLGIVTKLDVLRAFAFGPRTVVPRYEEIMHQPAETVMTRRPV